MQKVKIGLYGILGVYNYGCEAIVRGTYRLIKKAYPDCEITLYTFCLEYDQEKLADIDIKIQKVPMNKFLLCRRIINKLLRIMEVNLQLSIVNAKEVARKCDLIFSIGGDIYAIPQFILDAKVETKYSSIVEFGKTVLRQKPLVIFGASMGPFGNKSKVKRYYFDHLKTATIIFCREVGTYSYLKNNMVTNNIQLSPDPAFFVKEKIIGNKFTKASRFRIALNLSPLSLLALFGKSNESFMADLVESICHIVDIPDIEVVFIPHVVSPLSEADNDLVFLKNIIEMIPSQYRSSISLFETSKGFLETKEYLKTCDMVIAARMHCAINAICEAIPTIFLTYSKKAIDMSQYIYGDTKWAISLLEIKNELKIKAQEMLENRYDISNQIAKRLDEINEDEARIVEILKKMI